MRRAAQAATIGFGALMVFQAALAAGAPLGDAAWGGAHAHLTTAERVGSAISVFIYLAAILVVRGRAAGREEGRYRRGIWAIVSETCNSRVSAERLRIAMDSVIAAVSLTRRYCRKLFMASSTR